jgi:hypothetical protein
MLEEITVLRRDHRSPDARRKSLGVDREPSFLACEYAD